MKDFIFNWNIFKAQGFEFQEMCADIFRANQYHVRVMGKGGSDEGRDIIIYEHIPKSLIEFSDRPYAWVECKSQIEGSLINLGKIKTNFLYVFKENISYLIFITNHKFNNEAHNLFVEYNKTKNLPFKIRYIEKSELENILRATPSVYLRYFDKDGKIEDYPEVDFDNTKKYKIEANSYFVDEFEDIFVSIKNLSFLTENIDIQLTNDINIKEILGPFEVKRVKIPLDKSKLPDEIKLSYKIDHIYVDPFNIKNKIISQLTFNNSIYICGNAGTGKSRLLNEISKELHTKPIIFDISTNYSKSFLDYLLSKLFEMEIEYLNILPETVIISYLQDLVPDENIIPLFVSYIKHNNQELNYDIILTETAEFFNRKFQNQIIFIDNIHCFSILDFRLFERINSKNCNNYLIFTARENEIIEKNLSQYLYRLFEEKKIGKIDLSEIDIKISIDNFIEGVSTDERTKSFLSFYQNAENFQQFIFTLKTLRLKGIIAQNEEGKIFISKGKKKLDIHDYKELFQDLSKYLQVKFPNKKVSEILELGATFGYNFPIELIEDFYGNDAIDIIDNLIIQEFLKDDNKEFNGNILVNFDHELTREIIYNAIPPIQKKKIHKQIIDYIENLGESSSLYSYGQLAHHYECINNITKVAELSNKEGHKQKQKSQLETAFQFFNKSLKYVEIAQKENISDLYTTEADSLDQIIKLQFDLLGTNNIYGKIRSLEVISHLLNNSYYKGIAAYYFAKYYFEIGDGEKSLSKLQSSIDLFCDSEFQIEYGNSLNFKGVILKNNKNFELAEKIHEQAIKIFENQSYWPGMSESLADLGAVFLENGKGEKAVDFWKKSLDISKKTINSIEICNRLIDYSYILALFDKHNPEIKDEMENAVFMAEKLNIKPSICRAKINYSNFLFFNCDSIDFPKIKLLIDNSIKMSHEINDDYLSLLCQFSYYTFRKKNVELFDQEFRESIVELLLNFYPENEMNVNEGDNRITNITKFLIAERNEKISAVLENPTPSGLKEFIRNIKKDKLDIIEKDNPYLINGLFATYY